MKTSPSQAIGAAAIDTSLFSVTVVFQMRLPVLKS